jgi:hypothetical protein
MRYQQTWRAEFSGGKGSHMKRECVALVVVWSFKALGL